MASAGDTGQRFIGELGCETESSIANLAICQRVSNSLVGELGQFQIYRPPAMAALMFIISAGGI